MELCFDLDENTMDVIKQETSLTSQINVTVYLLRSDIRSKDVMDRISALWREIDPIKSQIADVQLHTTESNANFIRPLTWLFPLPLTPVVH
jgi:hypothetical protein